MALAWSGDVVPIAPFCLRKRSSLIAVSDQVDQQQDESRERHSERDCWPVASTQHCGHNRHQVASDYRLRDIVMVAILQLTRAIGGRG